MNILITGTSSGLGYSLANEFLKNGATVFGISRRQNAALEQYDDYHHLSQDLSFLDELPEALVRFLQGVTTLDLVVLNAGTFPGKSLNGAISVKELSVLMQVNVWANKVIIDSLLKTVHFIHQVVAITTGSLINNSRSLHTFALSKIILNRWIRLYAREVPQTHFTALFPGFVDSGLQEYISQLPNDEQCPAVRKLQMMRQKGLMIPPDHAANYLVEAMGCAMQEESGSYKDIADLLALEPPVQEPAPEQNPMTSPLADKIRRMVGNSHRIHHGN
ncbi:MAG: SDR family NAD(P)-dependent oxidoreductase [Bacteroidales bacterium]